MIKKAFKSSKMLAKMALFSAVGFILIMSLFIFGVVAAAGDDDDEDSEANEALSYLGLSAEVLAYRPLVEQYCLEYDISEYVIYILAIMQVESRGLGNDVMQCSESLGLPLNSLEPEESIQQGCYYFSTLLSSADAYGCDVYTVIQAYNYGGGFIPYVADNGGNYTFSLAMDYASEKSSAVRVSYINAIAVSVNGGWRYAYGNMFYVQLVSQYLASDYIWPSDSCYIVTSVYGDRIHPVSGVNKHHNGIDIGAAFGTNVLASAGGTVILSEYYSGYGNCIIIDHGNGYTTLYGHMSQLNVTVGTTVIQGQVIGLVGSTGTATGPHIHFEVSLNGERTDPLEYFAESLYTYG